MRRLLSIVAFVLCLVGPSLYAQEPKPLTGHYLFAWTGDRAHQGKDFLAVIDADPSSPNYGHLLTTLATDQTTMRVHHTEYTMPASGMLFANDHDAGRTFVFDLHDPLHPSIATSFTEMAGYMHPHSYLRLPNGHVLVSFQHSHASMHSGSVGQSGGLVEIDDRGKLIRSASNADPAFREAWLTPYSLVPLPEIDRVVSTNSSMDVEGIFRGVTYPFPGDWCVVPTIVGHFLVQTAPFAHAAIVLDIANGAKPVEVSRVKFDDNYYPHWCAWDAATNRIVITPGNSGHSRLYLLKFSPQSGALTMDDSFRDRDSRPGFNFENREWPHEWKGSGSPHGAVFSR